MDHQRLLGLFGQVEGRVGVLGRPVPGVAQAFAAAVAGLYVVLRPPGPYLGAAVVQLLHQAGAAGVAGVAAGEGAEAGQEPAGLGFPVEDDGSGDRLQEDPADEVGRAADVGDQSGEELFGRPVVAQDVVGTGDDVRRVRLKQVRDRGRFRGERLGFLGPGCRRSVARETEQVITLVRIEPQGRREGVTGTSDDRAKRTRLRPSARCRVHDEVVDRVPLRVEVAVARDEP